MCVCVCVCVCARACVHYRDTSSPWGQKSTCDSQEDFQTLVGIACILEKFTILSEKLITLSDGILLPKTLTLNFIYTFNLNLCSPLTERIDIGSLKSSI